MTQTTIVVVPGVYQVIVDDSALTVAHQWMISGSWTTKLLENQNGLTQAVGGIKQPYNQASLASDYTSTSGTYVAVGMAASITPTDTAVEVIGSLTVQNNTANDGVGVALYRTTGTAPVQGAAVGADTKVWENTTIHAVAGQNMSLGFDFVDTGLSVGQAYQYYLVFKQITSGTIKAVGNATLQAACSFYVQNI